MKNSKESEEADRLIDRHFGDKPWTDADGNNYINWKPSEAEEKMFTKYIDTHHPPVLNFTVREFKRDDKLEISQGEGFSIIGTLTISEYNNLTAENRKDLESRGITFKLKRTLRQRFKNFLKWILKEQH